MKNPIVLFISTSLLLAIIFFTLPINLFDGVVEYEEPYKTYTLEQPLSLSYFIGIGYDEADMVYVKSFRLSVKGYIMAFIFILGLPALLAYRLHLRK
jgi:hypothetical protein